MGQARPTFLLALSLFDEAVAEGVEDDVFDVFVAAAVLGVA